MILFFFNDTATTEIYTLSLHDALPISPPRGAVRAARSGAFALDDVRLDCRDRGAARRASTAPEGGSAELLDDPRAQRSEEHTSELQSLAYLVCRLLLEKNKMNRICR